MFGLSFGANKTKQSSTTDINKTETTNQTETGTKTSTGTTTNTGTSATTGTSNTSTSQAGTSTQQSTGSQQSTSTTSQFSDAVLGGLNSAVSSLLGAIPTTTQQLGGSFNHDEFIQEGMDAASSKVQSDLDASLNSIFDSIGGRDDSNSMATLLATRARSDAGAALAGTRGSLEAQAQDIEKNRFLANLQGIGQNQSFLENILAALKGGQSTTTGAVQTAENTTGATTNTGTSATQEAQNTATSSTQIQNLIEALNNVLSGTVNTTGTESTKSKGSTIGGGASLSL